MSGVAGLWGRRKERGGGGGFGVGFYGNDAGGGGLREKSGSESWGEKRCKMVGHLKID